MHCISNGCQTGRDSQLCDRADLPESQQRFLRAFSTFSRRGADRRDHDQNGRRIICSCPYQLPALLSSTRRVFLRKLRRLYGFTESGVWNYSAEYECKQIRNECQTKTFIASLAHIRIYRAENVTYTCKQTDGTDIPSVNTLIAYVSYYKKY